MEIPDGGHFDPRLYNPDNHTYREPYWQKEERINRLSFLKEVFSLFVWQITTP